jgi:riboflavin synthase
MKLENVKKKYKDEWILAEVLEEDEEGEPTEIKVIAHSKNRDHTYDAMKKVKGKYSYHFYTGAIPPKGYAVAFHVKISF